MDDEKVVLLRKGPKLNDVPGQLRALADRIEKGLEREAGTTAVVVVAETPAHIAVSMYGDFYNVFHAIGLLWSAQRVIDSSR